MQLDNCELWTRILKYLAAGIIVAIATCSIHGHDVCLQHCLIIGIIVATTFSVLDLFAPSIGLTGAMRQVKNMAQFQ